MLHYPGRPRSIEKVGLAESLECGEQSVSEVRVERCLNLVIRTGFEVRDLKCGRVPIGGYWGGVDPAGVVVQVARVDEHGESESGNGR